MLEAIDAFDDVPFARTVLKQMIKKKGKIFKDKRIRAKREDTAELLLPSDSYISVLTRIDAFHMQLIRPRIDWFNEKKERAQALLDSLVPAKGDAPSLRLIDHLVVQYARENSIMIQGDSDTDVPFDLWSSYRRKLSSIGKKYFDVFKRKYHVTLHILGQRIQATLGQVVFMQWYINCKLPQYMSEHIDEVRNHMRKLEADFKAKKVSVDSVKSRQPSKTNVVKPVPFAFLGSFDMVFE